jgi:hypothetical protein
MADGVYRDRDVVELMGSDRFRRVVELDRHHHDDEGRRYWSWDELVECEGILDFEDGIDEGDRRDATLDGPE